MATTALPFAAGAARPGGPTVTASLPPAEELIHAMSTTRTGLFIIAVIAVVMIAVAIMNIVWGGGSTTAIAGDAKAKSSYEGDAKKCKAYTNKMRDYVSLAGSVVVLITSLLSIYKTYPKMR